MSSVSRTNITYNVVFQMYLVIVGKMFHRNIIHPTNKHLTYRISIY